MTRRPHPGVVRVRVIDSRRGVIPTTGGRTVGREANNPQQSWGFDGEPPEAVMKDFGTREGTS